MTFLTTRLALEKHVLKRMRGRHFRLRRYTPFVNRKETLCTHRTIHTLGFLFCDELAAYRDAPRPTRRRAHNNVGNALLGGWLDG